MPNDRIIKNSHILVVDEDPANVPMLEQCLDEAGYLHVHSLSDPTRVVAVCEEVSPDIVLLDLNGYDVLKQLRRSEGGCLPILVFTADATAESRNTALKCGANDFLTKPGDPTEVLLRVRNFLETRHLKKELQDQGTYLQERIDDLENSRLETLERLARAADYRDDETGAHTRRVGVMSSAIAKFLDSPDADPLLLEMAAPLHDLGKIGIPDSVLLKPGRLSSSEFAIMKTHTTIGAQILAGSESDVLKVAEVIALTHHERWDGGGYPQGLSKTDIPLAGRIVAVADVFDALTHERAYKRAWTVYDAINEIVKGKQTHFDPDVVTAFTSCMEACLDRAS